MRVGSGRPQRRGAVGYGGGSGDGYQGSVLVPKGTSPQNDSIRLLVAECLQIVALLLYPDRALTGRTCNCGR